MRSQYVREIDEAERRKMQNLTVSSDRPYNRNRSGHTGFSSVYDGQYGGNLNWWWGIPNQEERKRLIEVDKEFP